MSTVKDAGYKNEEDQSSISGPSQESGGEVEVYPLSFAQQRLWFLDQWNPGNTAYNLPAAIRLEGVLDTRALEQSLNEIMRRHEALRTTFAFENEEPVQLISPSQKFTLKILDLRQIPQAEREARAVELATEEADLPFDLAVGPLLRGSLLRLGKTDHVLLLTMHHIISDGWSMGVFIQELAPLYEAFSTGEPPSLPELPIQYADFAVWQRENLQGEVLEKQLSYWRRQLDGELTVLELPTDHPRPATQTFRGAQLSKTLSLALSKEILASCQREGVTLFMNALAAFNVLLHRYTGQQDIIIGTPIANRNRPEIEPLIGFFVNTLVIRTAVSANLTYRELLSRVREATLGAFENQDVPFEALVQELQPQRDASRSPMFQVLFVVQNAPMPPLKLQGLELRIMPIEAGGSKFDLTLVVQEQDDGILLAIEYNTDLFVAATIERMLGHLETLFEAVVKRPEEKVSRMEMLSQAELNQVLFEWNDTSAPFPHNLCLHQLFERQADLTPDAVALEFRGSLLTYRQLNERANSLARLLIGRGAGPERIVAVCVDRSAGMVVAVLAVLKSGAAYLPLDPAYPSQRLAYMLEDAGARLLVTERKYAGEFPDQGQEVICLDEVGDEGAGHGGQNVGSDVEAGNLAYVIYTSGSTGRPKGVPIEHHSAVAMVSWARGYYSAEELSAVLASTSICFDLSVFEMFVPLSVGGRVVVVGNALEVIGGEVSEEVSLINTVPSAMGELVRAGAIREGVKVVNLAGEALSNRLAQEVYAGSKVSRVINLYGPSEDTTYSTYSEVERGSRRVPAIGRPISNGEVYVLDGEMMPVSVGVVGEVYVGGEGVARGYWGRAGMTAERYLPDPYGGGEGSRMYRTGDLGRYRESGEIEYVGRKDQQVKVRGYRIEMGEIEEVVKGHAGVEEAVVEARGEEKELVCYVVAKEGEEVRVRDLKEYIRERLPEYMVPGKVVEMGSMPLTANGKVDRKALPAPDKAQPKSRTEYVAPRNIIEEAVAGIWRDILGVQQVSMLDNFFDIGGHSILAMRLLSRLRETFRVQLPVRVFFGAATVAELSQALVANEAKPGRTEKIARLLSKVAEMSTEELGKILQQGGRKRGLA